MDSVWLPAQFWLDQCILAPLLAFRPIDEKALLRILEKHSTVLATFLYGCGRAVAGLFKKVKKELVSVPTI